MHFPKAIVLLATCLLPVVLGLPTEDVQHAKRQFGVFGESRSAT